MRALSLSCVHVDLSVYAPLKMLIQLSLFCSFSKNHLLQHMDSTATYLSWNAFVATISGKSHSIREELQNLRLHIESIWTSILNQRFCCWEQRECIYVSCTCKYSSKISVASYMKVKVTQVTGLSWLPCPLPRVWYLFLINLRRKKSSNVKTTLFSFPQHDFSPWWFYVHSQICSFSGYSVLSKLSVRGWAFDRLIITTSTQSKGNVIV